MKRQRTYSSYHQAETSSIFGLALRIFAIVSVLALAGGITWLAITPLDAPVREVVRPVASDKLGG